jgi:hypothetical protein
MLMQARIERYEGVSIVTSSACSTPDRKEHNWERGSWRATVDRLLRFQN